MIIPIICISLLVVLITILFFLIVGYSSSSPSSSLSSLSNKKKNNKSNDNYKRTNHKILNDDDVEYYKKLGLTVDKVNSNDQVIVLSINKPLMDVISDNIDDDRQKVLNIIKSISHISILFIIVNVHNDDEQVKIQEEFLHDIIDEDYLPIHRILFYETEIGKVAIVRQINPNVYFDNNKVTRDKLIPHINDVRDCDQLFAP